MPRHYPGGKDGPRQPWRRAVLHALFVGLSALGLFLALDRDSKRSTDSLLAASESLEADGLALTSLAAEGASPPVSGGPQGSSPPTVYARDEASELARIAKEQVRPVAVTIRVQEGDTVVKLARAFDVSAESIIANNPGIIDAGSLRAGQEITVPGADGIVHAVRLKDTLNKVARAYNTTPEAIRQFTGNLGAIDDEGNLQPGATILAAGGTIPDEEEEAPVEETPTPEPTPEATEPPTEEPAPEPPAEETAEPTAEEEDRDEDEEPENEAEPEPEPVDDGPSSSGFIWPVRACQSFSEGMLFHNSERPGHNGLDIPLATCSIGANIVAAAGGVVTLAGWNGGYGILVVVDHGNGYETWYAHLSEATVVVGEQVSQGERIGISGCTGSCYGEHLHFEVHVNGVAVNPLNYLP